MLLGALFVSGLGASTQHPIASALVARAFAGPRSLKALGTYNFAGDLGKMTVPADAVADAAGDGRGVRRSPFSAVSASRMAAVIFFATPRSDAKRDRRSAGAELKAANEPQAPSRTRLPAAARASA